VYLFKPLTTGILLALAAAGGNAHGARYQVAVTLGLCFSLLGDVILMLPRNRFLAGLVSFLLAHLAYLTAFTSGVPFGAVLSLLPPLLAIGLILLYVLWPGLGRMRLPVLLYTNVIVVMVWQALSRGRVLGSTGATLAAVGAVLFMASDALLALDRFRKPLPHRQVWIMVSYGVAQALIALSVGVA
jgi:uncharacterized membrane protein YhhN